MWLDYRFLTKEMLKFLAKQDMDLFYELLNQRHKLQDIIEQTADDGFRASPEGRTLLTEIQRDSDIIRENLQIKLGKSKRQNRVAQAYSSVSTTAVSQMNRKP